MSVYKPIDPPRTPCPDSLSGDTLPNGDRLRLLLVISSLEHGGAQRQVVQLANHLDPRRFAVHVCSLSSVVPLAEGLDARVATLHVLPKRCRFDVGLTWRLARLMRVLDIDIAHAFLFDAEMAVRTAAQLAGVPVVVASERNCDYESPWLHRIGFRVTSQWFDVLIANSHAGKRHNVRRLGIDPERIAVVYNGVDCVRFRPGDRAAARLRLGLPPGGPVVGMVATFKRQKNHADFFRLAARVRERFPGARFLCVGEPLRDNQQGAGDYHRAMQALVRSMMLDDCCHFLGACADMPSVYRACDLTVLPSLREGTPNVLLESMACGVPVLATQVADNDRIVPDGRAGFLVPVGHVEALCERACALLASESWRSAMGCAAREWAATWFSIARLAQETGEVYLRAWAEKCGSLGKARPGRGRGRSTPKGTARGSAAPECHGATSLVPGLAVEAAPRNGRPLRVLMALPDRRVRGGPPSHLYLLRDTLVARGLQVPFFLYGARTPEESTCRRLTGRLADLLRFPYLIVLHRPDLIQLNSAFDRKGVLRDVCFIPLARLLRQRVLLKFHGSDLIFLGTANPWWRALQALVVRSASGVAVLSREERVAFLQRFPNCRVLVAKNALNLSRYESPTAFRLRFGLPANRPLLLFIARFIPAKGLTDVIAALPAIRERHDVQAVFVGDGPERAAAESLCRRLNLEGCTTFTGYLPEEETLGAYREADLLVFPTYHQEGMPMTVFHALASGLPVVTTRLRALADWLEDGRHCVFVPPHDPAALARAVGALLDDPQRRSALAAAGRELVRGFDHPAVAAEFIALYRVLKGPPPGSHAHDGQLAATT
ncbi:MAG TPA: glycosyltransferase [Phycisphaerae bacterium]|nr:glycosyltransferase [Phycisphaerae bacterium]HNU44562.1 glycosyltransferase [Phycisphaerae bacterium]